MKPLYIYASRLRAFWVLLPMSLVLTLSVRYNDSVSGLLKLYPLIIFMAGAIVFTFIFLFRFISISYSEVRYIGRFTSRDAVKINEGKSLVIEVLEKNRVSIRVYGNEGYNPDIKWLTDGDKEVCIFRGKVFGAEEIAVRILNYFDVPSEDINRLICDEEGYKASYENVSVTSETVDSHLQLSVHFDRTV